MSKEFDFIFSIILALIGFLSIVAIVLLYFSNVITNEKEKGLIYFLFALVSIISYGFSYTKYKSSR